jgi:hypothetical protein
VLHFAILLGAFAIATLGSQITRYKSTKNALVNIVSSWHLTVYDIPDQTIFLHLANGNGIASQFAR